MITTLGSILRQDILTVSDILSWSTQDSLVPIVLHEDPLKN